MALATKRLVCITFLLIGFGCSSKTSNDSIRQKLSFLALGDSYTIGESVPIEQRWPVQLADSLEAYGFEIDTTQIIATTGWTTSELQQGIENTQTTPPYGLVSLLIGVNNQYRGYDIHIYRAEFEELLQQAVSFAGDDPSKVFVVSIPNYGVTPFGMTRGEDRIRRELLKYDSIADSIASAYGIPFVNITPISENAKTNMDLIASDELHPSGEQYRLWVTEMLPVVKELLVAQ